MNSEIVDDLKEYKRMKEELLNIDKTQTQDQDFLNLVSLNNIEPELRNTLILLHSNYKAELKELRSLSYKVLFKIVDENYIILNKLHTEILNLETKYSKLKETEAKGVLNIKNIKIALKVIITCIITMVILFTMASLNQNAYLTVVNSIKEFISLSKDEPNHPNFHNHKPRDIDNNKNKERNE